MRNFTNGIVSLVKAPLCAKNNIFVNIGINGVSVFVSQGSVVLERCFDCNKESRKLTKIWATEEEHKGNVWRVRGKTAVDVRVIDGNGSFDHFLEFENTTTGESSYGGTTVDSVIYDYYEVSKERAFLQAD